MLGSRNANWNAAIHATVIFLIRQNQIMDFLYDALRHRCIVLDKHTHKIKCFFVPNSFHMILKRLLVNGQSAKYHISLTQGECIAFDGIGVVGIFNCEFLVESFNLTGSQWTAGIQLFLFLNDKLK